MKKLIFKEHFLKKNRTRITYGFFVLLVGGGIIGSISYHMNKPNEERENSKQHQVANILLEKDTEKRIIKNNYFLEANHDPAALVCEQFNYSSSINESMDATIQQLEEEVDQLVVTFAKEKNKKEAVTTLENSQKISTSEKKHSNFHPVDSAEKENSFHNQQKIWRHPQLVIASSSIIINQHDHFDPLDYFKIISGSDPSPKVAYNFIDTSKLGEQKFFIQMTDSSGAVFHQIIHFFINSLPILSLNDSSLHHPIGKPLDLLKGVSAFDQEDGVLTSKVQINTNLDIQVEGTYDVMYSIIDRHGAQTSVNRTVKIENKAPVLHVSELIEHQINQFLNVFDYVQASDTEDGNIQLDESNLLETNLNLKKEGEYFFKIGNVKDSHGKFAEERTFIVQITNEAPKIQQANMQVNVFSSLKKEDYLAQLIVSDREDSAERLKIELDEFAWNQLDTTKCQRHVIPIKVTDTNGKTTSSSGEITIVNESPKFIGVVDRKLTIGEKFDPLAGISIYDKEESLFLTDVDVTETVDVNTPGIYTINLSINDSFERVTTSYQLTVTDNQEMKEKERKDGLF
ncbi:immunoglobulin-like domain-containing protein [Enterococcus ratti]|uniref:Pesticidal crystal protein Cry22Aa Ig-like domain-containing protein n=1 Tax=Enterococcus ratti TaxID=150033 RepID=A0A1L8WNR7_9ENTE|nr:immunoglobulin-like domain-containing protein [Enterococcus ratti]OJG82663.1 hypothetical protein RV14_GL002238 [Enterococcus ratti]